MSEEEVGRADLDAKEEAAYEGAQRALRNRRFELDFDDLPLRARAEVGLMIERGACHIPSRVWRLSMAALCFMLAASGLAHETLTAGSHGILPAKIVPNAMHADRIREELRLERLGGDKTRLTRSV